MRRVLALALGVLLAELLLFGSATDLGATHEPAATALLFVACGAGALMRGGTCVGSRRRDAIALVLAILLRGPVCDALFAVLPGSAGSAWITIAFATLVPAGLLLGRLVRGALEGVFALALIGLCVGALAAVAGVMGLLPAWFAVPLVVALVWWLARAPEACRFESSAVAAPAATPAAPPAAATPGARSAGVLVGAAFALVIVCFRRLVPAYATPTAHPGLDVLLVLCLPAAVVAWPAGVLARGRGARWLGVLGGLALCAAALITTDSLGLYENSAALVGLKRLFHDRALKAGGLVADWHVWLLSFAGALTAALGIASGALRGTRSVACALLGAGVAQAAECLLVTSHGPLGDDLVSGPLHLLLAAASCGLLLVPLFLFGRKGWLALPLAVLPFLDWDTESGAPWFSTEQLKPVAGFDEVRRPGEYSAEFFERTLLADVTVFSTPGMNSRALEGRDAFTQTLSPRTPVFHFGPTGEFLSTLDDDSHAHAEPDGDPTRASGSDPATPGQPVPETVIERFYGVRVAGRPLHAQHTPIGAEGSVGRLTRLFAVPGRMLLCGIGAELVAADMHDSWQARSAVVASAVPLGQRGLQLLLDHLGSSGWQPASVGDPQAALRLTQPSSIDTLVIVPAEESLPGATELCARESLDRMRALLAPGGRCLLWIDTAQLGARELRARLAAFGAVFGARGAAFVEPRELDPPFVLLVGWIDDAGLPSAPDLQARLPGRDATGFRTRLRTVEDLAALLLRDGDGLVELADAGPVHSRLRPISSVAGAEAGWAAVASVAGAAPRLGSVIEGAGDARAGLREVFHGLALHGRYAYRLLGINETLLEIKPDVEWSAFDAEVASYTRASAEDRDDPLLQQALAALLEPLAIVGDLTRFANVYEACHAAEMRSWRLALQEAWVRKQGLQPEQSAEAIERARRWATGG